MKKLGVVVALLILFSFLPGLISCAKAPVEKPPTAPPMAPTTTTAEKPFKPIKLKFGDFRAMIPGYFGTPAMNTPAIQAINDLCAGRLVLEVYDSATLLTPAVAEQQIAQGIAECGAAGKVTPGILPMVDITRLPPMHGEISALQHQMIFNFLLHDYLKKDYEAMNLVNLASLHLQATPIITTKKPAYKIEDLKGLALILTDPIGIKLLSGMGAVMIPVSASTDGYETLSKGIADGAVIGWNGPFVWGWLDLFKPGYFIDVGGVQFNAATSNFLMNKQVYDSLPQDLREIVTYQAWRWSGIWCSAWNDTIVPRYQSLIKEKALPYKIIVWSNEEQAKFTKAKLKNVDAWIEDMEKKYKRGAEAAELVKIYSDAVLRYVPPAPVPQDPRLCPDPEQKAKWTAEWNAVYGPGSNWGVGYKAYPNQTGLHKLEGNEFRPWK